MQKIVGITGATPGFGRVLRPADIVEIVHRVTTVPPHVDASTVEVMPVCQSCGPLAVPRES